MPWSERRQVARRRYRGRTGHRWRQAGGKGHLQAGVVSLLATRKHLVGSRRLLARVSIRGGVLLPMSVCHVQRAVRVSPHIEVTAQLWSMRPAASEATPQHRTTRARICCCDPWLHVEPPKDAIPHRRKSELPHPPMHDPRRLNERFTDAGKLASCTTMERDALADQRWLRGVIQRTIVWFRDERASAAGAQL